MRIAVVGAGVFGLAAAIEAAVRGHEVSVFEQGEVPHHAASSTDVAKGIRRMWYASDNETYVELAERAAVQWRAWEERSGERFYHRVGSLRAVADFSAGSAMRASADFLLDRGAEIAVLSADEAGQRFPQIRFAVGETCVFDPWAGYLESARAIGVMAGLARDGGCQVCPSTPVINVEERASGVEVTYRGGRDRFDRVVVAAGPWLGRLLPSVGAGVTITRQQMLLIEPPEPRAFSGDSFPVWMIDDDSAGWYGFPLLRGGYAKVARDRPGEAIDPDVDRAGTEDFARDALEFVRRRLPGLAAGVVIEGRSCLYTNTPDDHFLVDRVPGTERVFIAGGGSGHGFKFGGALGPVIIDAVEEHHNPLGDRFRIGNRLAAARGAGSNQKRGFAQPPPA